MGKMMSPQQIEANRRNGQKSTGPKTPEGRVISSRNALKHGILSKQVVVRGLNIKESEAEFSALHDRFRQDLNPVGPVEEMLVDQIVTCHWRLRRALVAESGEIALSVDDGHWARQRPNLQLQAILWANSNDAALAMMDSSLGCSILAGWVNNLRNQIDQEGELTEASIKSAFGNSPVYSEKFEKLRLRLLERNKDAEPHRRREENKKEALDFIDRELNNLQWQRKRQSKQEEAQREARRATEVLPAMPVIEKIFRYETKLEKQLFRAMNYLERLQRRRQGENVPPPMTMDLSERL
ncbi:MAG TPA: hypothetical protein VFC44_22135 [Candidatus Saccharimonadales bacterium]|nr:hypothetical protein [Candidatus Saccharimonadales bacterium]